MNRNLLIATKNRDKFTILSAIINRLLPDIACHAAFEYDVGTPDETGSVQDRAADKAIHYLSHMDGRFEFALGSDDSLRIAEADIDEKDSETVGRLLLKGVFPIGTAVKLKEAISLVSKTSIVDTKTAIIPFVYVGANKRALYIENHYPLLSVLGAPGDQHPLITRRMEGVIEYFSDFYRPSLWEMLYPYFGDRGQ
jgi:hypothetical protein